MIIQIDFQGEVPIYEQIRNQIILGIASGQIKHGESLSSVRRLAQSIGVNLHTVNKAYALLSDEGYIVMDRRRGASVAEKMGVDENFNHRLHDNMMILMAEAKCRGVSLEVIQEICKECYMVE